jgi:hypothetical protein
MLDVGRESRRPFFSPKNLVGYFDGARAGNTDERNRAFTRRRGDGGDGVRNRHDYEK